MAAGIAFDVTGVAALLQRLDGFQGAKLRTKTTASLRSSANKVIAPRLVRSGGWKYGGHAGKWDTRGLLGRRRSVTAKNIRTRSGEFVAISVKPRGPAGTIEAWVVKGTKPHDITAGSMGALVVGSGFYGTVHHPGATATDYIGQASRGIPEGAVLEQLAKDLFSSHLDQLV